MWIQERFGVRSEGQFTYTELFREDSRVLSHHVRWLRLSVIQNSSVGKYKLVACLRPGGGYSHIVWVGVCHWVRESPTLY